MGTVCQPALGMQNVLSISCTRALQSNFKPNLSTHAAGPPQQTTDVSQHPLSTTIKAFKIQQKIKSEKLKVTRVLLKRICLRNLIVDPVAELI